MSDQNDLPLSDLSSRLRQGPLRRTPFEYRRPSIMQSEASDYTARPKPSPAAPRYTPALSATSRTRVPFVVVARIPPGSRKGMETAANSDDERKRAPNESA